MARMEGGDLVALDAKYHRECLTTLQNRYRQDAFLHTEGPHNDEAKEAENGPEESNISVLGYSSKHGARGSHLHQITPQGKVSFVCGKPEGIGSMVLRFRPPQLCEVAPNTHPRHGEATSTHSQGV